MRMDGLYSALQQPPAAVGNTAKPQEQTVSTASAPVRHKQVLHMVKNERMGGSVPVWKTQSIESINGTSKGFEIALTGALNGEDAAITNTALAYNPAEPEIGIPVGEKPFSFGDLVDIANPLHHIPLVNYAYRGITGDEIRPIGQIVGGALYGGPIGAASGVVNAVAQEETGKDIAGNAISMIRGEERTQSFVERQAPSPNGNDQDLPGQMLAVVNLNEHTARASFTDKPATQHGFSEFKGLKYPNLSENSQPREPITELLLNTPNT